MANKIDFDEHIGTPPPSTVVLNRIIKRERRGRRLRRLVGGGAMAVVIALAITASVTLAGGTGPATNPAAGSPSAFLWPSASPSPSPTASRSAVDSLPTPSQLQTALEQSLAEVAPDARWVYMPDVPGEPPLPDGHPVVQQESGLPPGFAARAGLARHGQRAGFYLWLRYNGCLYGGGPSVCAPALTCKDAAPAQCHESTTPSGLEVLETTDTPSFEETRYRFYGVQVLLPNNYYLKVDAVNYFGGDGSPVSSPTPMLTKAELKKMALIIADKIPR